MGDTHTIQALSAGGQAVTGLTWKSSDPTVVSLSTDDPPVLTALAAGHVTVTAGTGSADVTVWAGALPVGTAVWSNPGDGSGVQSIVPAVPSATGVADVFAIQNDWTVQAITADGTTAWTADVSGAQSPHPGSILPDFQGGLVIAGDNNSVDPDGNAWIQKLDGVTGAPSPQFSLGPHTVILPGAVPGRLKVAVHPDGTVFALVVNADSDDLSVVGVNPTTGRQFSVPLDDFSGGSYLGLIIAGDGYAYVSYGILVPDPDPLILHYRVKLLRIGTDGSYSMIDVYDCVDSVFGLNPNFPMEVLGMITNADSGVLFTWLRRDNTTGMAVTAGTSTSVVPQLASGGPVVPVLQAQDGSFVGQYPDSNTGNQDMVSFDATGNVRWVVPGEMPAIAISDGSVIGQSGVIYDQNGSATGQMNLPTYSWLGYAYQVGSVDQVKGHWYTRAMNWASSVLAYFFRPDYTELQSCHDQTLHPPPSCPGPKDATFNAWYWLRTRLSDSTRAVSLNTYVFTAQPPGSGTINLAAFIGYLGRGPEFYDGNKSNVSWKDAQCKSDDGSYKDGTLAGFFIDSNNQNSCDVAVVTCPGRPANPLRSFFEQRAIYLDVDNQGNATYNVARLFHEALHGFTGKTDPQLQAFLGCTVGEDTRDITLYLQQFIGTQSPPTPPSQRRARP